MFTRQTKQGKILLAVAVCIPLALLLWPPLYNVYNPALMGVPFFYWFQVLCLIVAAALIALFHFWKR